MENEPKVKNRWCICKKHYGILTPGEIIYATIFSKQGLIELRKEKSWGPIYRIQWIDFIQHFDYAAPQDIVKWRLKNKK